MIIKVDIDNTLFNTSYKDGKYIIEMPNYVFINKINDFYDQGHKIIIMTGRHWNHFDNTVKQLKTYKVKYHSLVMGDVPADIIVDDKSIKPEDFLNEF